MLRCGDLARPPMNRTKVARSIRRNSEASLRCLLSDFISANMKKNTGGGASRKNVVAGRSISKPNGSRRNSSRRKKDLPRRGIDHATQRYADLYDLAPNGYVSFDRSGRIEEINLTAAHLFGMPRDRLIGMPFMVFVSRQDTALFLHHLLRCRCSDIRVETEMRLKNIKREIIHAYLSSKPVTASVHNGALLYQTAIVDVTERKKAEEVLRQSEERLRAIVQQTNAGMARYDLKGRIEFVNSAFCTMLGYKESELIGKSVREITHPEDVERTMAVFERILKKGEQSEIEKRYIRKNGSIVWVNVCKAAERDAAGGAKSVVAVVVNISRRKKAEAALRKSKDLLEKRVSERTCELHTANKELEAEIEQRKGLEGEILTISDREQQRLGQELHDGICQHLTAVAFMARSIALRLRNHRVIDANDIDKIAELVNAAAADTRNLSLALHRSDVDAAGLMNALQDLVDREIWKVPCRLEMKPSFHIENDMAAAQLYRIAREAVINANKHSQAREIVVRLERSLKGMVLHIIDDGVGFVPDSKVNHGLGCHIMNYRAQVIGGRLEINSPKRGGTCVSCYFSDSALHPDKKNVRPERLPAKLTKLWPH